jgi:hypothetical protein
MLSSEINSMRVPVLKFASAALIAFLTFNFWISRSYYLFLAKAQYDDSYITYRYAANIALGKGFVFNDGEHTNSASSLVYTILLSPFYLIWGESLPNIAILIGTLSSSLICVFFIIIIYTTRVNAFKILISLLAVTLWLSNPYVQYWTNSGMETVFFCLVFSIAIWALVYYPIFTSASRKLNSLFLVIVTSLAALTRIEGLIVLQSIALLQLIRLLIKNRKQRHPRIKMNNEILLINLSLGITTITFFTWNRIYFGQFIPNPINFKRHVRYYDRELSDDIERMLQYLQIPHNSIPLLVILCLAIYLLIRKNKFAEKTFLLMLAATIYGLFNVLGAYSDFNRYNLPLSLLLILILISLVLEIEISNKILRKFYSPIILAIVTGLIFNSNAGFSKLAESTSVYSYLQEGRIIAGKFVDSNYRNQRILASDIGALSFYGIHNQWIDASGLTDSNLVNAIRGGDSYCKYIDGRNIDLLADTFGQNETSGSEGIYLRPLDYFSKIPNSIEIRTSCKKNGIARKNQLLKYPSDEGTGLSIQVWDLELISKSSQ